jgi:hypothetical protein
MAITKSSRALTKACVMTHHHPPSVTLDVNVLVVRANDGQTRSLGRRRFREHVLVLASPERGSGTCVCCNLPRPHPTREEHSLAVDHPLFSLHTAHGPVGVLENLRHWCVFEYLNATALRKAPVVVQRVAQRQCEQRCAMWRAIHSCRVCVWVTRRGVVCCGARGVGCCAVVHVAWRAVLWCTWRGVVCCAVVHVAWGIVWFGKV